MLPDIQSETPEHKVWINRVGIKDMEVPIALLKKDYTLQYTVANVSCYVDLSEDKRGVDMSRIPYAINQGIPGIFDYKRMIDMAKDILSATGGNICQLTYSFPYFICKKAPVTQTQGMVSYQVSFIIQFWRKDKLDSLTFTIGIGAIATTCCPCSKAVSKQNAHNQKCQINISVECANDAWVWIEDLIGIAERGASCEIYSVLKRPDEAAITKKMYDNPRFVEDVVREIYSGLEKLSGIRRYSIEAISDESIHLHKAYAKIEGKV
jgi:GTP cyclohydrolase I